MTRCIKSVVGALLLAASTASAQSLAAQSGAVRDVTLAPGDVVHIDVWRNKEFTGDFLIARDGTITHPLYRDLVVAGLPMDSVRSMIRSFLAKYETSPAFTVTPMLRVIVAGEVRQPNLLTVPAGTTVAQAIAMSGGPTERALLEKVRLVRRTGSTSLNNAVGTALTDTELRSGDEVFVPRRRSVMQDIVAPSSSILAALASITTVVLQATRR